MVSAAAREENRQGQIEEGENGLAGPISGQPAKLFWINFAE